ncbi:hypothetical protein NDU88_007828 [Pleurodeles waltl]|uniref:Uncharacterized protein n=1 Tax=Pleurodeles waltl TaxID=8319 RepID=A0AAV7N7F5_PLEWA|nr:hypothetical protein NDU88_007828 [Pleurodeles waltl]
MEAVRQRTCSCNRPVWIGGPNVESQEVGASGPGLGRNEPCPHRRRDHPVEALYLRCSEKGARLSRPRLRVLQKTLSTGQNFEDWAGGASPRADNRGETWQEEERFSLGACLSQYVGDYDRDREKTQGAPWSGIRDCPERRLLHLATGDNLHGRLKAW